MISASSSADFQPISPIVQQIRPHFLAVRFVDYWYRTALGAAVVIPPTSNTDRQEP